MPKNNDDDNVNNNSKKGDSKTTRKQDRSNSKNTDIFVHKMGLRQQFSSLHARACDADGGDGGDGDSDGCDGGGGGGAADVLALLKDHPASIGVVALVCHGSFVRRRLVRRLVLVQQNYPPLRILL